MSGEHKSLRVHSAAGYLPRLGLVGSMLCAWLLVGCGKSDSAPKIDPNAGLPPEAAAVRKAFQSASPSYRNPIEEALALVRAGQVNQTALAEALPQLERIAANSTISAGQKQALDVLVQKIKSSGVKLAPVRELR